MINKDAKLTFNHLSKDLQKAYLECKENNYFYSNKAFDKVEVVGLPTTFLLEWNKEQQKKVYNTLMKVFKNILSIYKEGFHVNYS